MEPPADFSIYQFVKDFQTLIVGALGFLGVMGTLIVNSWLTRRQHDQELENIRQTTRVALLAELERNQETFQLNLERIDSCGMAQGVFVPSKPLCQIYESLLNRVGYLQPNEARAVYEAYTHIPLVQQEARLIVDMYLMEADVKRPFPDFDQFPVPVKQLPTIRTAIEIALEKTSEAITVLKV